jgi:hypothetical protein
MMDSAARLLRIEVAHSGVGFQSGTSRSTAARGSYGHGK